MRAQSWILIIIALGCGLVASIGISQVMDRGDSNESAEMPMEQIFIALVDIPTGDPITPQMIKLEKWPKDKVPEGALTKLEEVEKRRPRSAIIKGEPILERKLIGANEKGAIDQLQEGYQAVAIKVTAEDVSGGIVRPGDRVNVFVYLQKGDEIPATGIKTLMKNVRVFAIDSEVERGEKEGKTMQAKTVTLELTEKDAAMITLAQLKGKIRLTLRRPGETTVDDEKGGEFVSIEELTMEGGKKKPEETEKTEGTAKTEPENKGVNPLDVLGTLAGSFAGPAEGAASQKPAFRMVFVTPNGKTVYECPEKGDPYEVSSTTTSSSTPTSLPLAPATNDKAKQIGPVPAAEMEEGEGGEFPFPEN